MLVIYLVTSLEAIGDVTATSKVSRQPVEGPVWMQRIKGGCWSTAPTRCWPAVQHLP
jgi:xanthine/uracil permease